jgi:hypothetical protein
VTPIVTGIAPPSPIVFHIGGESEDDDDKEDDDDDATTIGSRLHKPVTKIPATKIPATKSASATSSGKKKRSFVNLSLKLGKDAGLVKRLRKNRGEVFKVAKTH